MLYPLNLDAEQYTESVITLLKLARGDTGGSRVAAQVLLSSYNGNNFQLNIADLGNLDTKNYTCAMNVIHGRKVLMTEPHKTIEDGSSHFEELCMQWEGLSINHRFKSRCSSCYGTGSKLDEEGDEINGTECYSCSGTGRTLPRELKYDESFLKRDSQ